jgi:NAD(P)-dependent dehydrogenase (short-subunit alcohol dehydrogenase family)
MKGPVKKEHVLVIGGSKGTGRAVVQTMAQKGYLVSVVSRKLPEKKIEGVHYRAVDITKPGDFSKVFKGIIRDLGPLNHLVFCQQLRGAGDEWGGQIDTSLTAVKHVIESAVDDFENVKGKNTIVLISSIVGRLVATEQPVGYHVAKAGVDQMTRYYAMALGPQGIRVNAVAPNSVLKEENKDFYLRNSKIYDLYKGISPLGKMVTSEDVANTIAFLCSLQSAGITGQILVIDAGVMLQDHEGMARTLMSLDSTQITQRKYKQRITRR